MSLLYLYGMCYVPVSRFTKVSTVCVSAIGALEQQWGSQWADLQEMLIFCQGSYLTRYALQVGACFVALCGTSFYVTVLFACGVGLESRRESVAVADTGWGDHWNDLQDIFTCYEGGNPFLT